jgi:diaminopimelate epimerase
MAMNVWYMSGAGNDFMVIDARGGEYDFKALALKLCKLTDADGFMAVDTSEVADFRLHFYNSDGSRGEMCGNGARCICKFAYDHGIAPETMTVQTDAGIVDGWRLGENLYRVKLNNPGALDLSRREDSAYVELGDPGVPHGVTEVPGLTWEMGDELRCYAVALRHAPEFPKGANINFYTWLDETTVRVLTFERGVEDYTLACGTGCGSVACVLWSKGLLPGGKLTAKNKGGDLTVTLGAEDGEITSILLEGPAQVLKTYEL